MAAKAKQEQNDDESLVIESLERYDYSNYLKSYRNNSNLKRPGQSIQWTSELIAEYVKCSRDPVYFIETYMKIIGDEGLVNFKLYPYQKEMILSFHDNRFSIVATARQAGKSTAVCGYMLWYIIFNSGKTVALLANKGETAREILGRVQLAYQYLPLWLQQGIVSWNKGSIDLENDSRVIAAATSSSAIRGYSIDFLFIDEAAHIEGWNAFFGSTYPTIASRKQSKIILVSTPLGLNHFWSIWTNAINKKNNYNSIMVSWQDVPGRDEQWKLDTLASMNFNTEKFAQEFEVEFLGSSGTLIAGWKLKELVGIDPIHRDDNLSLFVSPIKDHLYVCVVDTSRGKGLDYSAFHIIDVTTMPYKQVAVYHDNLITPMDYCSIIHSTCKSYNNAYVLIEINDIGEQIGYSLYNDHEYEYIFFTESSGRGGKKVTAGFGKGVDYGIVTSKTVKANGCAMIKLLIEQNQLVINDFKTISEFSTFSRKNNSYMAEVGKHDDLVMPLVLFGWLSDQQYFKDMTSINTIQKLRDKTDEDIAANLVPFGFVDNGIETVEEVTTKISPSWFDMNYEELENYVFNDHLL